MSAYGLAGSATGGGLVFVSGQTGHPELGDLAAQLRTAYGRIEVILAGHGLGLVDVVDETVFVTDATDWAIVADVRHQVYGGRFAMASTLVQVAGFPHPEIRCEVKVVAASKEA